MLIIYLIVSVGQESGPSFTKSAASGALMRSVLTCVLSASSAKEGFILKLVYVVDSMNQFP